MRLCQSTRTFLNCHGSSRSRSSGNSAFAVVERRPIAIDPDDLAEIGPGDLEDAREIQLLRLDDAARGCSIAHTMPASTAAVTCSEVALLCGAARRASSIDRREPYQ